MEEPKRTKDIKSVMERLEKDGRKKLGCNPGPWQWNGSDGWKSHCRNKGCDSEFTIDLRIMTSMPSPRSASLK